MKHIKKFTLMFLVVFILCSANAVSYAKYSVKELYIENIDIPDGYISCTRDECDPELESIILSDAQFPTMNDWNTKFMENGNVYVHAIQADDPSKCMYLTCEKLASPKTRDGLVEHILALDYNLAESATDRDNLLKNANTAASATDAVWVTSNSSTAYIEYNVNSVDDYKHVYETVYCGNKIFLYFTSKVAFTNEEKQIHQKILDSLKHSDTVKYTEDGKEKTAPYSELLDELKKEIETAKQKKLIDESNTGKNTRILWYIIGVLVALIIVFSIYMAIRSRSKKRKKVIVLREYEVTDEDNAISQNKNKIKGDK